jgi:hypothetical protein
MICTRAAPAGVPEALQKEHPGRNCFCNIAKLLTIVMVSSQMQRSCSEMLTLLPCVLWRYAQSSVMDWHEVDLKWYGICALRLAVWLVTRGAVNNSEDFNEASGFFAAPTGHDSTARLRRSYENAPNCDAADCNFMNLIAQSRQTFDAQL